MYSTPLKGTNTKKIKLSWFDYYFSHCWMTGWQSIGDTFRIWTHLMTSKYENYALMKEDDPEAECLDWFWASLNEDDVYDKDFLEYLMKLCEDVDTGKVRTYPMEDVMSDIMKGLDEDT
jgi:hypothetical protein